ncbi:hypothetical protein SAMN05444156_0348 [Verrucomicrobium sp. GAS474]|uniref:glycosyltransferase n=1 Tax=Verrucomicrobium sp. GAS474 TaxID=1882831 RepID=UPI00087DE97D|nr:hypothetical protein [Verrucomicrobium sp. GAS474]SDT87810.1 hypothetical protein SAMN05444156_0348 [Verrucomicrobium sp. GAS474]
MRILVSGLLAQYPFGGVIWDYVQYLIGFRDLGHDVWYLEDSGMWPYHPVEQTYTEDASHNIAALGRLLGEFGFGDRWIYRNGANGQFHSANGLLGEKEARALVRDSDLLANVSGAANLTGYEGGRCHRMYLDGDPMFTHIDLLTDPAKCATILAHDSHFTFGLNVGAADCRVPTGKLDWKKTVQPVSLRHWPVLPSPPKHGYTTVMNWASYASRTWEGDDYGQKDLEFRRFFDLPKSVPAERLTLAMGQGPKRQRPTEALREAGWEILEPNEVVPDHLTYRDFLSASKGEWSIAKNGYVRSRSGWFSCRTACYLAAGRPAVVQETGWSAHLPHGKDAGVYPFETEADVAAAMESIAGDYEGHRRAARRMAEEHFDAPKVCADLLKQAGL